MKKDVIISILGRPYYDGHAEMPIELVTDGRFYRKNGHYFLTYRESDLTGLGNTLTTMKIEAGKVTVSRSGEISSQMIFEEGRRHISMYEIDEGALIMALTTRAIKSELSDTGGRFEIDYAIDMNGISAGVNLLRVDIRDSAPPIS